MKKLIIQLSLKVWLVPGMISTSFFWGFMTDTFGRKKIMSYGYMFTGIMSLATCFSHTSWLLILFKFLDGVM